MVLISVFVFSSWDTVKQSAQIISFTAVVPGCGNGIIEDGEECDTSEYAGASCQTKGFTGGTLSCTRSCLYNVTACTRPSSSGGGGGGRSTKKPTSVNNAAQVIVSGYAYPQSAVTVLKDTQIVATGTSALDGSFQVGVRGLASGKHSFSVYTTDMLGSRSAVVLFPIILTKGIVSKVDALFLPPTLRVDKIKVKQAEQVTFLGQTTPATTVEIIVGKQKVSATSGADGQYSKQLDTASLPMGVYTAEAQAVRGQQRSASSSMVRFTISTTTILAPATGRCVVIGDLNDDCRVSLVDFSILAFWFQQPLTPEIISREKQHLSGDGKINIIDFSIMAFHWTG